MDTCPKCHRKLISHISPRCNWCGELITDEQYQREAAPKREAFLAEQRIDTEAELARVEAMNVNFSGVFGINPGRRRRPSILPPYGALPPQPTPPPAQQAPPPVEKAPEDEVDVDETKERFGHLEF